MELQKALISTTLSTRLRARPEPTQLVSRGVLRAQPGTSAGSVLVKTLSLHRTLVKQAVERKLRKRSEPQTLLERGVLVPAAPVLPHELPLVVAARYEMHSQLVKLCRLLRSYLDLRYMMPQEPITPRLWTLEASRAGRRLSRKHQP